MLEWVLITILFVANLALLWVFRNAVRTMQNMRFRLFEIADVVDEYKEYLEQTYMQIKQFVQYNNILL